MKLSVMERIALLSILPREGDFLTLKELREFKESLAPKPDEIEKFGIQSQEDGGMTNYTWEKNEEVEIPINEFKRKIAYDALKLLDKNKHLDENCFSLYEKFVVAKDEEDKKVK